MESLPLQITASFAGVLALLLMALSINVTRHRARSETSLGDGDDVPLLEAGRMFGNCAEYVPIVVILMGAAELNGASPMLLYVTGGLMLAGRVIHPFGLKKDRMITAARMVGMSLTWAALGVGAVVVLLQVARII